MIEELSNLDPYIKTSCPGCSSSAPCEERWPLHPRTSCLAVFGRARQTLDHAGERLRTRARTHADLVTERIRQGHLGTSRTSRRKGERNRAAEPDLGRGPVRLAGVEGTAVEGNRVGYCQRSVSDSGNAHLRSSGFSNKMLAIATGSRRQPTERGSCLCENNLDLRGLGLRRG